MNSSIRLTPALVKATAGLGLTAVLVAGCASNKSTPVAAPATSGAAAAASSTAALAPAAAAGSSAAAAPAASSPAAAAGPASVAVKTGPLGAYLVDATGRSLYLFTDDKGTTSTCYAKCATFWPPLLTGGAPQASAGATASLLGTTARTDRSTQVTYNGHPVYYFAADKAAGVTKGQGTGGTWFLVAPAGTQIGTAPAAGASASPTPAKTSAAAGGAWS